MKLVNKLDEEKMMRAHSCQQIRISILLLRRLILLQGKDNLVLAGGGIIYLMVEFLT